MGRTAGAGGRRQLGAGTARRRQRTRGHRCRLQRRGRERLRPRPPARSSLERGHRDGLLPVQQRRDRRPRRAARPGIERVAIVDWDVHHGNGTQDVFYDDPSVLFVSIHQDDLYPAGSGTLEQRGGPEAPGATVNIPLPAGCGDAAYLAAFERVVEPALERFGPELLLISAGQDPAASDPLGRMSVTAGGFRALTERALAIAGRICDDRLVVVLEGGYSLEQLPFCNLAIAEALAGADPDLRRRSARARRPRWAARARAGGARRRGRRPPLSRMAR